MHVDGKNGYIWMDPMRSFYFHIYCKLVYKTNYAYGVYDILLASLFLEIGFLLGFLFSLST